LTEVAVDEEVPKICDVVVTGVELVVVVVAVESCGVATNSPRQVMHSQFLAFVSGCGKTQQIVWYFFLHRTHFTIEALSGCLHRGQAMVDCHPTIAPENKMFCR
jgi:hypothetical protein